MAELLLRDLPEGTSLLADKGYDADWIRNMIEDRMHPATAAEGA